MSDSTSPASRSGRTQSTIEKENVPRLPHEHDESSDSQTNGTRRVIQQAHDDIASGKLDTGRSVPMDQAYQKQKEAPAPNKKKGSRA